MDIKFFDSHCHPQLAAFEADREDVLARMREAGVGGVAVGVDLTTSREAVELARTHDFLWAAVGLHPNDLPAGGSAKIFDAAAFKELTKNERVVAIGECGLDYFRNPDAEKGRQAQLERFREHVALALEVKKPLVIHCRSSAGTNDAQEDMLRELGNHSRELENGSLKAVMHFFTASRDVAERYLALGCYLSFPCVITFTDMYDDAVRATPLEKLLVETDSPFAAPASHRGKRNEPVYVESVVRRVAELKNLPFEEVSARVLRNSQNFFAT